MNESDSRTKVIIAAILIIIGAAGILDQVFHIRIFSMNHLWPIFVLAIGITFEWSYFSTRRSPGLLVPGGILVTLGLLFLFETCTHWKFSDYTWPVYLLAPAIGLFQLYWYGKKEKGLLIPVGMLAGIALISFCQEIIDGFFSFIDSSVIWSIALVVVGIYILFDRNDHHHEA